MSWISKLLPAALLAGGALAGSARGADYRVKPSVADVLPGDTVPMWVEVATIAGDNLVGIGHYSFAVDLSVTGTAGADGSAVSNVQINEAVFDDTDFNVIGAPSGPGFIGTGGVIDDVFGPNPGGVVGDVILLFSFDLAVPALAQPGDVIVITPSEGFLESLTVNAGFDNVDPQSFGTAALTVVPEPATLKLLALAGTLAIARRRMRPA